MNKEPGEETKKDLKVNKEKREGTKRKENFYAKNNEIKSAFYTNKSMFVLLYKEMLLNINDFCSSLLSVVSSLLQEFEYVFPEDGPSGLPPIKGIEHQIDFIPKATILNQLAYRTNPEETKELQHQVKELISPYVVYVLLVPKNDCSWRMCIYFRTINKIMVNI